MEVGEDPERGRPTATAAALTAMSKRILHPGKRDVVTLALRLSVVFIVLPGGAAALGAIIETVIYGDMNRPNFNDQFFAYSALIAAPFILLRWYWPWRQHALKLELAYYVLFTSGFLVAVVLSTLAGQEAYRIGSHAREIFNGPSHARFADIQTEDDIHDWLNATLGSIFGDELPAGSVSRPLGSRVFLLSGVRLVQSRSPTKQCSVGVSNIAGGICYTSRHETSAVDKTSYSSVGYQYKNPPYQSLSSQQILASDIKVSGQAHSYGLDGFWVMIGPDFSPSNVSAILQALRDPAHPWLDHQTSMVMVDAVIVTPDTPAPIIGLVSFIVESTASGLYIPSPPYVSLNQMDDTDIAVMNEKGQCVPPPLHRNFFLPMFMGVVPAVIYLIFRHVLQIKENFVKYLRRPFTYSEVGWIVCVVLSMVFRWRSISFEHCDNVVFQQDVFGSGESLDVGLFEFVPIARWWFESRRVLGMAVFLHLFTALKFLVRLQALGGLVKTLQLAGRELGSFSLSFAVLFMGFVLMFYIVFSIEAVQFSTLSRCVGTLWLGMLGELEITDELWRVKEWTLPVIIIFTFISVFVLLTVIVAIISDAHERAREAKERADLAQRRVIETFQSWRQRRTSAKSPATTFRGRLSSRLSIFSLHNHRMSTTSTIAGRKKSTAPTIPEDVNEGQSTSEPSTAATQKTSEASMARGVTFRSAAARAARQSSVSSSSNNSDERTNSAAFLVADSDAKESSSTESVQMRVLKKC